MYSVVVLMALSGGVDTPDFGGRRGCHGCSGGGGCHGGGRRHGCHGGGGCYGGGCYGGGCYGGYGGCYGGGGYGGCYGGGMGGGCYGGYGGCYGGGCGGGMGGPMYMPREMGPRPMPGGRGSLDTPSPATIVVSLPAEAKLTIDDFVTSSTSERRVFVSPDLTPGKTYSYTFKAEVMRDNKPVTVSKEVTVRAGEETPVTIEFPAAVTAQR